MRTLNQRLISPFSISFADAPAIGYTSRYQTIGHAVLAADARAETVPNQVLMKLDDTISSVVATVRPSLVETVGEARAVLASIEEVITRSRFVCSIPYYLVHSFVQGLAEQVLDKKLVYSLENELRRDFLLAHGEEMFSHVDCDLGTLLYLSIGEVLDLPLHMVEVPGHNFVRWRLPDGSALNWETNYGYGRYTDENYKAAYGVTPAQMEAGIYLVDMSRENTLGYFSFIRGITHERAKQPAEAAREYNDALAQYPQSPSPLNNLAWLYVTSRSAQQIITGAEALRHATKACEFERSADMLDTLACVMAQCGDFASAIVMESEAYALKPVPEFQEMIQAFREGKTWLDVHGAI